MIIFISKPLNLKFSLRANWLSLQVIGVFMKLFSFV